jgi:transcriptional regulator with XRE-family HTH domain
MAADPPRASRSTFPGFADLAVDTDELVRRLIEVRRRHGLSQTEVAARMGTSQSAVARLEAGQSDARLSTLARYAAALDTRLGYAIAPQEDDS